jgi:hypothetical protein
MNEQDAKAALRAQGITNPSKALVENWLRVQCYEEAASPPPAPRVTVVDTQPCISSSVSLEGAPLSEAPHPSSESNLEPLLRERGEFQRPTGPRKAGRPRVEAPWFQALANLMADGSIPLRQALHHLGVQGLTERQMRALYRNSALTKMRLEARQKCLRQGGITPRDRRRYACKGGLHLGVSRQLLRLL